MRTTARSLCRHQSTNNNNNTYYYYYHATTAIIHQLLMTIALKLWGERASLRDYTPSTP